MKRIIIAAAACCLFAVAAFAQKAPDFSGTWVLDVSKSKLDERARIESMTLTVTQSENDIKIVSKTTRTPRPEGAQSGMRGERGTGGGGRFGTGHASESYALDGRETKIEQEGPNGMIPVTMRAKFAAGKLELLSSRTINSQMGEMSVTKKEVWAFSDEGKTLTIVRENSTPRGTATSTLVFSKK